MVKLIDPFRSATPDDAEDVVRLVDMAAHGLASWMWSEMAEPGETAMQVGIDRARREEGGFSYRNATVYEVDRRAAGLLLGGVIPSEPEEIDYASLARPLHPLVELEAEAPGTWYVNALAVDPDYRGQGIGTALLDLAVRYAADLDAAGLSLIAAEQNERAVQLYRRLGYEETARRPIIPYPGDPHEGDWLLMTRSL